jgi:hypothetical protein
MNTARLVAIAVTLVAACGTIPPEKRRLEAVEHTLGTNGTTTLLFHSSLYYPREISLRFDGYIVGIEKSPRDAISSQGDVKVVSIPNAGLSEDEARHKINDSKLLYVSHIIETKSERGGIDNCSIYNAYSQVEHPDVEQLTPPCDPTDKSRRISAKLAYNSSWGALDRLRSSIKERLRNGKYTDLIVVTMGWNTVQEEAVRNFNSVVSNLKVAAGDSFSPLVIGVTWPSQWESNWFEPIYQLFSFPAKAADADELGLAWLGVLLHRTIPGIQPKVRVTVIGHSFGSRASSVAACIGPAIYEDNGPVELAPIDNLINLQGAFMSTRFFGKKDRGMHYPNSCSNVANIVLTSSKHDHAMNSAFWGVYAGDERSYAEHCSPDAHINCFRADSHGGIPYARRTPGSNITYVDADAVIFENAFLSGGGAHSDIYRREHGVLIKNLIPGLGDK